jgi:LacI family transcriptional regulator
VVLNKITKMFNGACKWVYYFYAHVCIVIFRGKMATTKDIARELGISHSTVSRVLSNNTRVSISAETRERVEEAARRLNYRSNALARSLQQGKTNTIGVYSGYGVLNLGMGFFSQILFGLQVGGADLNLDLLLHCFHYHSKLTAQQVRERQELQLQRLHDGRVDGFVVCAQPDDFLSERLQKSNLSIVSVAELFPNIPSVLADDAGGMEQLIEHVLQRGHRKWLFLALEGRFSSARRRFVAFEKILNSAAISPSVWTLPVGTEVEAVQRWMNLPQSERPTAICCWNDTMAYNFLHAANALGLRAPEDFALTGFDGFPDIHPQAVQQVCTASCDWYEAGKTAINLLHKLIEGGNVPAETILPTTLIRGDTA